MAISYPIAFPSTGGIRRAPRRLVPSEARAPTRGALQQVIGLGVPLWRIDIETVHLTNERFATWEAWLDALNGGAGYFKAVNPRTKYPVGRPLGYAGAVQAGTSDPFDGTGVIDNVDLSLSRVRLTGLPNEAGFAPGLKAGDVVSIAHTSQGRGLYRVAADATSNSSGECTLLDLRPALTARVANGAAYAIVDPWFEAVIDSKTVQLRDEVGQRTLAFTGWQVIR